MNCNYPHICKYCKYKAHGMCYYNPPTTMFVDYQWQAVHPPVYDEERCSKWELNSKLNKENN